MARNYSVAVPSLPEHKKHDEASIKDIVDRFRVGDYTRKHEFILDHARFAIVIGSRIDGEDGIGVAFEALCLIPDEVQEGRLTDYGLIGYTISRIKTRCINAKRKNMVLNIPTTTAHRHKLTLHRIVSPSQALQHRDNVRNISDYVDTYGHGEDANRAMLNSFPDIGGEDRERVRVMFTEILSCTVTSFESEIIKLRAQWYTDDEIATLVGCGRTKVREARLDVERRWNLLKDELE